MSLGGRATGHLDDACFGTPVHFSQGSTGIGADIVADDIFYAILDVRLGDAASSGNDLPEQGCMRFRYCGLLRVR